MSDWTRVRVSDLIAAGTLLVEDGNHGEYRPKHGEFGAHGTAYIRAADLRSGGIDFEGAEAISDVAVRRIRKGIGAPLDVILSHKGTVGRVAFARADSPAFVCSPQTTVWRSLNHSEIDARFLYYSLQSPAFQIQLTALKGESDMAPYVSLTEQRKLWLSVPPRHLQLAMAAVLGALDDKIAANHRIVNTALKLARAHYLSALSSKGHSHDKALGEVAAVLMGQSPPGESCNRLEEGRPLLNGPTEFGSHSPTPSQWTTVPTRLCMEGDLLLCVRGSTTGRLNWADREYVIGRGLAAIRAHRSPRHTILVYFALVEGMSDLLAAADGSVFPNLSRRAIESFPIAWPDDPAADVVGELLSSLADQVSVLEKENGALAKLRDLLLLKLMSGEIRVRRAEKIAEEVS